MSLSSLFKKPSTKSPSKHHAPTAAVDAVVELIYAGNSMANYLSFPDIDNASRECVCGARMFPWPALESTHHSHCPVLRFATAVDRVRKEVL